MSDLKYQQKTMTKKTIKLKIQDHLSNMEVGQEIFKADIVLGIWGYSDEFIRRSFDVALHYAKKDLHPMKFQTHTKGLIKRLE